MRVCVVRQDKGDGSLSQVTVAEARERIVEHGYWTAEQFDEIIEPLERRGGGPVTLPTDWALYEFTIEGSEWSSLGGNLKYIG